MQNSKFTISIIAVITGLLVFIIFNQAKQIHRLTDSQVVVYENDTIRNSVNLLQPENNIAFVPVTINGVSTIMMLDTGSGKCIIDLNQITELDLQILETTDKIHGVGGSNVTWQVTNCSDIGIKGIKYDANLTASNISNVVRLVELATGLRIAGVIGSDFMTQHSAVIDFKQDKFFLVTK